MLSICLSGIQFGEKSKCLIMRITVAITYQTYYITQLNGISYKTEKDEEHSHQYRATINTSREQTLWLTIFGRQHML